MMVCYIVSWSGRGCYPGYTVYSLVQCMNDIVYEKNIINYALLEQ